MTHTLAYHWEGAQAETVGEEHGLTKDERDALADETIEKVGLLKGMRARTRWRDLPHDRTLSQVDAVLEAAKALAGRFDDVVILGIGGSALGLTALKTALCPPFWNHLPKHRRDGHPRLWVLDNVDPAEIQTLLDAVLDEKRTLFNVISKSGTTAETMSQFLIVHELLKACVGDAWKQHLVVTTDAETGILRTWLGKEGQGIRSFVVPDGVGGRFSVLSPVGLFGAAMVGMDIEGLLAGAATMDQATRSEDFEANPAARAAAAQIGLYRKGKRMSVMMPYAAALEDVADWYRQLWAESLGKQRGDGAHVGPTPIKALGVTDQHSQVQLYREGPNDKVITILAVEDFGVDVQVPPAPPGVEGLDYLAGQSLAKLYHAEREATEWALGFSKRPTTRITLPEVSARILGELLQMLMVTTAIAGEMLGIDTYNQPGVEAGKVATKALMGAEGPIEKPEEKGLPAEAASMDALRGLIGDA